MSSSSSSHAPILPPYASSNNTKSNSVHKSSSSSSLHRATSSNNIKDVDDNQPNYDQRQHQRHERDRRSKHDDSADRFHKELGKIMRVRESYGFIYSYTREEDIFFHFSEIVDTASGSGMVRAGDDVEYEYGYSNNNNKAAALRVKVVNVDRSNMRKTGTVEKVAKGNVPGIIKLHNEGGLTVKYNLSLDYVFGKGDIVQVNLASSNGGRKLLGKDIILIESREEKMLQTIPLEEGVIVSLKDDCYGFIQSTKRKEHVYFHYSHLTPSCDRKDVKIGKCVEFKAINETMMDNTHNNSSISNASSSPAARQLNFLPDDSVQFRTVVQKALKGHVVSLPCTKSAPRGKKKKSALAQLHHPGTVRMVKPLIINDDNENKVSSVLFHMQDISPSIIPWMKEGDELAFDLAREHLDNTYCIQSPTLTKLALPGRAEGTITSLKEGFGFISLAERQADVYFRLSDNVLPSFMQKFLLKDSIDDNDNDDNNNTADESTSMAIGTEVSFDLSLACNNKNNNNMHHRNDKENLKAHRILSLPKGSITTQKTIATKVKGVITQLHNSVYLELDESVQGMTFEEHHPLIASMINSFIADKDSDDNDNVINDIVFTDVQSPHESRFIIALAESKGLNVSFASDTTTDDNTTHLRLKISKNDPQKQQSSSSSSNDQQITSSSEVSNVNKNKKSLKVSKPVKLIRFDKKNAIYSNNNENNSISTPLLGDIVTCDVVHSRRAQTHSAINLSLVERPVITNIQSPDNKSNRKQKAIQHNCVGLILMEPSHSNISSNHYSSSALSSSSSPSLKTTTGRWDNVTIDNHYSSSSSSSTTNMNDGHILLLESKNDAQEQQQPEDITNQKSITLQHLVYHNEHHHRSSYHPKRGEFVSFHYNKGGKVKDVKLLKNNLKESTTSTLSFPSSAVTKLIGTLTSIDKERQTAIFQLDNNHHKNNNDSSKLSSPSSSSYTISTEEILGCNMSSLTSTTQVEAMCYQNNIYGICRLSDLYLALSKNKSKTSTISPNFKGQQQQRPRLNLTVRKELGGKVIAQSSMAKGPSTDSGGDGGNHGFVTGWTKRCSRFEVVNEKINDNANDIASTTEDNCDCFIE